MSRTASARQIRVPPLRRGGARPSRKSGVGGTLIGLFIGIAIGIGLAAAVAFYLMKAGNPYQPAVTPGARDVPREPGRPGKPESSVAEKPRFDFYKIPPGIEEPKTPARPSERLAGDRATAERARAGEGRRLEEARPRPSSEARRTSRRNRRRSRPRSSGCRPGRSRTRGDAENLKAQLALSGWEATLQQANVPDRGVRYRVRLGPYGSAEEMNRVRGELVKRGFEVSAVR
jgi:cell division protein FtsN